jgi:hypothetical protein
MTEQRRVIDPYLQEHIQREEEQLKELREDIKQLQLDMTAFTDAWQQAKGVVQFVKWIVGISSGLVAFVLFIKDHIK